MMFIKNHFGLKLFQRYVHEIFYNKKNSDYALYQTDQDKAKFEKYFENHKKCSVCITWLLNMLNSKESSNGYLAHKSVIRRKSRPRTNQLQMSVTMEEFFEYYIKKIKYLNKENILRISLYKLVYSYLIEPKRLVGVDLFAIHLHCSVDHLYCVHKLYPKHESDVNSSTGRCVRLYTVESRFLAGVKGKFEFILPGNYEIICRIKLDKNEEYLTYYKEYCNGNQRLEKLMQCHFYALADHGLDCERNGNEMNFDWFESNYLLYGNQNWFNETMGQIKVFELSTIYCGFKIEYEYCYRNVLLDYIQLNIIE